MGRKAKYSVSLTIEQRNEVRQLINSSSKEISQETKARAKALWHLDTCGETPLCPEKTAVKAQLQTASVYEIRKKFCIKGFEATLYRKKRNTPPVEPKITGDVEARIIACACSKAPEGKSRWTLQMIANKIVVDGVIDSISDEAVRKVLKKRNSDLT